MQLSHYWDSDSTKIKPPCLRSHKREFPSCDNCVNNTILCINIIYFVSFFNLLVCNIYCAQIYLFCFIFQFTCMLYILCKHIWLLCTFTSTLDSTNFHLTNICLKYLYILYNHVTSDTTLFYNTCFLFVVVWHNTILYNFTITFIHKHSLYKFIFYMILWPITVKPVLMLYM